MNGNDPYLLLVDCAGDVKALTSSSKTLHHPLPLAGHYHGLAEGAWVVNRLEILCGPDAVTLVFRCPQPDVHLADGEIVRCPPLPEEIRQDPDLHADLDPDFAGFDRVPVSAFAAYWRAAGARIGRRRGDRILWEDGTAEPVPAVDATDHR